MTNFFIVTDNYTLAIKIIQIRTINFVGGLISMNTINFARIGRKIREIRISKNLTQEYVATIANVNVSHISNIENNRVKISLPTLVNVCNALDTTVDYILSDEYKNSSSVIEQEILREVHSCTAETQEQILKIIRVLK